MRHRRRGNRYFCNAIVGYAFGDEFEVGRLDRPLVSQFSRYGDARRGHIDRRLGIRRRRDHAFDRHTAELAKEVEVKPFAAEFAIGDALNSGPGEFRDHRFDFAILDLAQRIGIDLAGAELRAGLVNGRRTQQAADVIGAAGRGWCGHRVLLLTVETIRFSIAGGFVRVHIQQYFV